MRPPSIRLFDKVYLTGLVLDLVPPLLNFAAVAAQAEMQARQSGLKVAGIGQPLAAGSLALLVLTFGLLWYFIARRASTVAKWIFVAVTAYDLLNFSQALVQPGFARSYLVALNVASVLLHIYAASLLFKTDARAWFERGGADADNPVS